jgi:hypothetical protein
VAGLRRPVPLVEHAGLLVGGPVTLRVGEDLLDRAYVVLHVVGDEDLALAGGPHHVGHRLDVADDQRQPRL